MVLRFIGSKNSVSHTQRFKLRTAGLQILQLEKDCLGWKIYEIYSFLLLSRVRFAVFAIDKCSWPKSSGIKQVGIWDTAVSIQCHSATSSSLFNVIEWMANKRSKPVLAQKSISILRPFFVFVANKNIFCRYLTNHSFQGRYEISFSQLTCGSALQWLGKWLASD